MSEKIDGPETDRLPVILFAGKGSRLKRDLDGPKGLAPVGDETLVSLQVKRFKEGHRTPLVVVRKDEREAFESYFAKTNLSVTLVVDKDPTGPACSLVAALDSLTIPSHTVVVVLGDSICSSRTILEFVPPSDRMGAIAVAKRNPHNMGSSVVLYRKGILQAYKPKDFSKGWKWAGTAVLPWALAKCIKPSEKLLPELVALSRLGANLSVVKEAGTAINVNTLAELHAANELFRTSQGRPR